jgi:hypothetical protein
MAARWRSGPFYLLCAVSRGKARKTSSGGVSSLDKLNRVFFELRGAFWRPVGTRWPSDCLKKPPMDETWACRVGRRFSGGQDRGVGVQTALQHDDSKHAARESGSLFYYEEGPALVSTKQRPTHRPISSLTTNSSPYSNNFTSNLNIDDPKPSRSKYDARLSMDPWAGETFKWQVRLGKSGSALSRCVSETHGFPSHPLDAPVPFWAGDVFGHLRPISEILGETHQGLIPVTQNTRA